MRQPPEAEKDHQEQPIQTRAVGEHGPFQIPAATFQVLEGGFDAHASCVLADALASRGSVGEHDPGLALVRLEGSHSPGQPVDAPARAGRSRTSAARAVARYDHTESTSVPHVHGTVGRYAQQTDGTRTASHAAGRAGPADARPARDRPAACSRRLPETGSRGRAVRRPRPTGAAPISHGLAPPAALTGSRRDWTSRPRYSTVARSSSVVASSTKTRRRSRQKRRNEPSRWVHSGTTAIC